VLGSERVADANTFRLRRLEHAMRREVADGLLVRVSSIDPDRDRAFALQEAFLDALLTSLEPGARARLTGFRTNGRPATGATAEGVPWRAPAL
jgi:hypothetical protein